MSDKTQARPCKVNVVISQGELNGTQQLHQGFFLLSRLTGVCTVAKASKPLKFSRRRLVLHVGSVVPAHLSRGY